MMPRKGGGRPIMIEDNKGTRPWRADVKAMAFDAMEGRPIQYGDISATLTFFFPRPKSHVRPNGKLAKGAPAEMRRKPDIDKLQRAVFDALTGVVWKDDCQVYQVIAHKQWSDTPGALVDVFFTEGQDAPTDAPVSLPEP